MDTGGMGERVSGFLCCERRGVVSIPPGNACLLLRG
jgi:hypothetical protein